MRGFLDATQDPDLIRKWWSVPGAENSNIGIRPAPGVVVVDVDRRHGGFEALSTLKAEGKDLPDTLTVRTGGGGLHAFYTAPAEIAWPKEIVHGIDLKAENGYLVAASSTHESGERYEWVDVRPMAEAPAWLVSLGRNKNAPITVTVVDEDESEALPEETIAAVVAQLTPAFTEGRKHALSFAAGGWLRQRGWNQTDIARVIEALPSKSPRARVKDALDGYRAKNDHGWHTIQQLIGEAPAAALDAATPNPRRAVPSAVLEGMSASAVVLQPAAPLTFGRPAVAAPVPGQLPAWFVPDALSENPPPINYVVPGLELAPGRLNMVVGYSNAGKSISTQALAFDIAMGRPAWGQFLTKRRRVLYLDAENIIVTRENFARLAFAAGVPMEELRKWLTLVNSRFYMDSPNAEYEIASVIQREHYGAVFIDTFRASAPGVDENDKEASTPLYMLGRVSEGTDSMIVVLHHEKKPDGEKRSAAEHMISGHNSIHGTLQVAISMLRDDDSGTIAVRPSKRIRKGFEPFNLKIVDVGADNVGEAIAAGETTKGVKVEYVGAAPQKPVNEDTMAAALIRILGYLRATAGDGRQVRLESMLRTTELGGVGGKKQTNAAAIERLVRDGQVHVHGSPKMIALVVDAPAYDPRSFAPPEHADRPPLRDSMNAMASALYAQRDTAE
jgi:hypothetical protein